MKNVHTLTNWLVLHRSENNFLTDVSDCSPLSEWMPTMNLKNVRVPLFIFKKLAQELDSLPASLL